MIFQDIDKSERARTFAGSGVFNLSLSKFQLNYHCICPIMYDRS